MKKVRSIPEGSQTVTPFVIVNGAEEFMEFVKKAFGGVETFKFKEENNSVMHATMKIGNSTIMIADAMNEMPQETGMLYLYVEDVDKIYKEALNAKAESLQEPKDEFWGDRAGGVKDRWGNKWWIATHKEDVSMDELDRRAKANREQQAVAH